MNKIKNKQIKHHKTFINTKYKAKRKNKNKKKAKNFRNLIRH